MKGTRVGWALNRGRIYHGRRTPADFEPAPEELAATALDFSSITQTSLTVSWSVAVEGVPENVTGRLRYGTSPSQLNTLRTPTEESFGFSTHIQSISGLSPGTVYFFQAFGENVGGQGYESEVASVETVADVSSDIQYTDFSLSGVTSFGGFPIDPTGAVDSSRGINNWIQAQPNGTDAMNHSRLIFPPTATYRLGSAAICLGLKQHTTLWGHDSASSAWIRGDATSYQDPGCTLRPVHRSTPGAPYGSCFIYGARHTGSGSFPYSLGQANNDVTARGFDIISTNSNPGIYSSSNEGDATAEMGDSTDAQLAYCRSEGMGGDLVRFRSSLRGWVHHNYVLSTGRMGCTAVINIPGQARSDNLFEYNTIDRCGYWGIDLEPEDHATDSQRIYRGLIVRYNRWGSFATSGVGGGFAVIGGTATPGPSRVIADVEISGNVLDGFSFGTWGTSEQRSMWMISQHVVTNSARRVSNFIIRDNTQVGFDYSAPFAAVLTIRFCDGLVVTNNDANFTGSAATWMNDTGCTSVTESGNT